MVPRVAIATEVIGEWAWVLLSYVFDNNCPMYPMRSRFLMTHARYHRERVPRCRARKAFVPEGVQRDGGRRLLGRAAAVLGHSSSYGFVHPW